MFLWCSHQKPLVSESTSSISPDWKYFGIDCFEVGNILFRCQPRCDSGGYYDRIIELNIWNQAKPFVVLFFFLKRSRAALSNISNRNHRPTAPAAAACGEEDNQNVRKKITANSYKEETDWWLPFLFHCPQRQPETLIYSKTESVFV